MGSSGIRAGASNSPTVTRTGFDYLAPLKTGRGLDEAIDPTIATLQDLPKQAGFAENCVRVGGGFSAWRLALQRDRAKLASDLARIEAKSGVAVLVIPQKVEGAYGYYGARRLLGENFRSSHVLDIGGGSMQIAGESTTFGQALGQKVWHQKLCQAIRHTADQPCSLQPLTSQELSIARALLARELHGIERVLPKPITMTAVSRPVTQGVVPAVLHLLGKPMDQKDLSSRHLTVAIRMLSRLTLEETATRLSLSEKYATYLLSDMLLVEGLMMATRTSSLQIAEVDLTNLPGILADDVAFRWADHYGCYLERLRKVGLNAYASDPATCPATNRPTTLR
jgi:exopolyphosphatase/pppGpp-phosphohydrolase